MAPELSWASAIKLTTAQTETLKTINRWLRDTDGDTHRRTMIPMRERSLEIFGDENALTHSPPPRCSHLDASTPDYPVHRADPTTPGL
ncbi:hypothetical protein [Streptomyces noursei]|uniref:hypothetical protein n=1 Tax=Streptomyces noursei TaxID=1971 RepID=UPI0021A40203|nr:hypothetical protein [Streptomyces noursei]UWS69815.1 hypothetical protein N1H47_00055 [Streptomyces noursei]UWS76964.1 hypothetical protein N1H47_40465 [Streptomyces noursei]